MKNYFKFILAVALFVQPFSTLNANSLSLRGIEKLRWLSVPVYDARLYTRGQQQLFSGPVVLEISYHTSFKGVDIADRSVKEMIRAGAAPDFAESYRSQMMRIFPDVKPGTILTASYTPGEGITFYRGPLNYIGKIEGDEFARYFLSIWLENHDSGGNLKKPRLL